MSKFNPRLTVGERMAMSEREQTEWHKQLLAAWARNHAEYMNDDYNKDRSEYLAEMEATIEDAKGWNL